MTYEELGRQLGKFCDDKNKAYGNSFAKCAQFLKIFFPEGVPPEAYQDMLGFVRMFDKFMRLATDPTAFNEDPRKDLVGYSLLMLKAAMENNEKDPG